MAALRRIATEFFGATFMLGGFIGLGAAACAVNDGTTTVSGGTSDDWSVIFGCLGGGLAVGALFGLYCVVEQIREDRRSRLQAAWSVTRCDRCGWSYGHAPKVWRDGAWAHQCPLDAKKPPAGAGGVRRG